MKIIIVLLDYDVTEDYDKMYEDSLGPAEIYAYNLARNKAATNATDVSFRAALRLGGWRPITPVHHAAEFFSFNFEFADVPERTSLLANYKVAWTMKSQITSFVAGVHVSR